MKKAKSKKSKKKVTVRTSVLVAAAQHFHLR